MPSHCSVPLGNSQRSERVQTILLSELYSSPPFGEETPEVNLWGSTLLGQSVPLLARLALSGGHRQARNGRGLASQALGTMVGAHFGT